MMMNVLHQTRNKLKIILQEFMPSHHSRSNVQLHANTSGTALLNSAGLLVGDYNLTETLMTFELGKLLVKEVSKTNSSALEN